MSLSINLEAAFAASTFSDLLSNITNSTFLPNTSPTFSLASSIPSTVISPPAAFAPVKGSNTPILITSEEVASLPPHPDNVDNTNTADNKSNKYFFFINTSPFFYNILYSLYNYTRNIDYCQYSQNSTISAPGTVLFALKKELRQQ